MEVTLAGRFPLFVIANIEVHQKQGLLPALVTRQKRSLLLFTERELARAYIEDHIHGAIQTPVEIKTATELAEILLRLQEQGIKDVNLNPSKINSGLVTAQEVLAAINVGNR